MEFHVPDIVWTIINFIVFVAILNKFLYKPLLGMLESRKQEIQTNITSAETAKAEALKMKEEYTKHLQNAKQEAQEVLDRASKLGEETKNEIINQAREEAEKITERAQEIIRIEKEEALAHLRSEVATLVVMAAGKVIDRTISQADHEKLIRDSIQEVGMSLDQ